MRDSPGPAPAAHGRQPSLTSRLKYFVVTDVTGLLTELGLTCDLALVSLGTVRTRLPAGR